MTSKINLKKNPKVPIIIENDANCFTLAEVRAGSWTTSLEKEKGSFIENQIELSVILMTSLGGGLIHQGKFLGKKTGRT